MLRKLGSSVWNFVTNTRLGKISPRRMNRRQVSLTMNGRPSLVSCTDHPALHTGRNDTSFQTEILPSYITSNICTHILGLLVTLQLCILFFSSSRFMYILYSCFYYAYTGCSKKTDPLICFCNNFGTCTPILIPFSLLQQENNGAQNLSYFSHLAFIMLPLYLVKQTLMMYQCHYYIIIVFVYNLLHFNAFNHLHRLIWAE